MKPYIPKSTTNTLIDMNRPLLQSEPSLATRELLFIGFEGDFDANIRNFPYEGTAYRYAVKNDAAEAFAWLEQRVDRLETFQMPYAVLCKLQWLQTHQFGLCAQLMAHPFLRYIPLIALTEQGEMISTPVLAKNGIDDCYTVPVEWDMLEERLIFLNQYKPKILDAALIARLPKNYQYKLPLGKRIFDIIAASLGILLSIPVWLPIALAIRLESKGPVIYRSKRVGSGYHIFDFFKFRSMYLDADQRLHELQHLNQYRHNNNGSGPVFVKLSKDPRVTRVGRFIRKYSLDELPQFINVLRGDMSLVGNRPLPLYEAEMLVNEAWCERFLAPAGLTGLWQVSKRSQAEMSMEERIALDIKYAKNASIWTDFSIIIKTFGAFVQKDDA